MYIFSKVLEAVIKICVFIDNHALIQTCIEVTYCLMEFKKFGCETDADVFMSSVTQYFVNIQPLR